MCQAKKIDVIGLPVDCLNYESAIEACRSLASRNRPTAVSACNTQIAAASRLNKSFAKVMGKFDLILPDGMPIIWNMNLKSKVLSDRVYGPYFMEKLISATPSPYKHYLFGGTQKCLENLEKNICKIQPQIKIVGKFSPPFRPWTEEDQEQFAKMIAEHEPDFIWVALGGEKQEQWIIKDQLPRHQKGVFLAIGDAFELLAGHRSFAPNWMQKSGLTWSYRLFQEPNRLAKRYLKYNSLFIFYTALDCVIMRRKTRF